MMADTTRTDASSTEEILASIKKIMLEDEADLELPDADNAETGDRKVVQEMRRLIDEYTDLPEDLVRVVSELESEMQGDDPEFDGDPPLKLKELTGSSDLDNGETSSGSDALISSAMRQFLEKMSENVGLVSFDQRGNTEELDNTLALLFKVSAYRWLEKNLQPLVRELVRTEIERLAKNL
jgi:cell pole-organizing protein PopZ